VACVAEKIGEKVAGPGVGSEAFVCGLLHDVGKIALDTCLPKAYARVVERVERHYACICDVEREIFGLDHTVAGRRLIGRWQLPQAIGECAWLHHQAPEALPSSVAFGQLVRIVHLADDLVRREGIGYSGYGHVGDVEESAARVGVDADSLANLLDRLPERMEPFRELIGLDDVRSRNEYMASLAAANQQLGQINAKLAAANRHLEVRSACLSALEHFTKRLTGQDRIGDVCVAASESVRTMLDTERAVAFFSDAPGHCIHAGCSKTSDQDEAALVIDAGDSQDAMGLAPALPAGSDRGLVAAPDGCEMIWHRCMGMHPCEPLRLLPLADGSTVTGGVLISAGKEAIARFRSAPTECEAVSTAIGLALMSAKARVEAERTSEELLDLNRRLNAAQKEVVRQRSISMIAKMAAGAAHELNNPLSVISGRAQLELAGCDNEKTARGLKIIIDQTQQATRIVTDLMHFAKPAPPTPVTLVLSDLLEPLCQHWRASSPFGEEQLTLSLRDHGVTVCADGEQLREILNAVVTNAVEATKPETARLHINSPSRASDESIRIVVEDNGVGMTQDVLEHAFDPFFSSRPAGRGRGLGLSRAYRLAEINGGHLWVESTPNVGTTVTIELPARAPTY